MKEFFSVASGLSYLTNDLTADRPTLVFLHGLSGSSSAWLAYEPVFAHKYNLILVDLRGHGKSKRPINYRDYEVDKFADDLVELIRELRLQRFYLVGHSLGSLLAAGVLRLLPDETRSVVFLSPVFGLSRLRGARVTARLLRWAAGALRVMPFHAGRQQRVDYERFPNSGDWNAARLRADICNTGLHPYLYALAQIYAIDHRDWWRSLDKPCLIVHGRRDSLIPFKNAMLLAQETPHCAFVLLKDADHILVLNNVSDVGHAIERFIDNESVLRD
jgi:3-oxoadipate enol-lactonase